MYLNDPKAFIEYSQYMDDVYNSDDNPNKKKLIVFDDIIADIITNKKFQLTILLDAKNWIYLLYLSQYLIFLFQKKLD